MCHLLCGGISPHFPHISTIWGFSAIHPLLFIFIFIKIKIKRGRKWGGGGVGEKREGGKTKGRRDWKGEGKRVLIKKWDNLTSNILKFSYNIITTCSAKEG